MTQTLTTILSQISSKMRLSDFSAVIDLVDISLVSFPKAAALHHFKGVALWQEKQIDKAIASFESALSIEPQLIAAINCLGLLYADLKLYDKSIVLFEQCLSIDPKVTNVKLNLGRCLNIVCDYGPARTILLSAIDSEPASAQYHIELSISLRALHEYDLHVYGWCEYTPHFL